MGTRDLMWRTQGFVIYSLNLWEVWVTLHEVLGVGTRDRGA